VVVGLSSTCILIEDMVTLVAIVIQIGRTISSASFYLIICMGVSTGSLAHIGARLPMCDFSICMEVVSSMECFLVLAIC
jgi:hypothetical protein